MDDYSYFDFNSNSYEEPKKKINPKLITGAVLAGAGVALGAPVISKELKRAGKALTETSLLKQDKLLGLNKAMRSQMKIDPVINKTNKVYESLSKKKHFTSKVPELFQKNEDLFNARRMEISRDLGIPRLAKSIERTDNLRRIIGGAGNSKIVLPVGAGIGTGLVANKALSPREKVTIAIKDRR